MSNVNVTTGLISGLDFQAIIDASAIFQQRSIDKLNLRVVELDAKLAAISTVEANILSLTTSISALKEEDFFESITASISDPNQLNVSIGESTEPGTYNFQGVQKAATFQAISRGYTDSSQSVGTGTITIAQDGFLDEPTLLETLNDGAGVQRGQIRITDRSGDSATIDLTQIITVTDVLDAINNSVDIDVTASVSDDKLILTDNTGSTSSSLSVVDLDGGSTATDLGIQQSIAANTLTGSSVYTVTENFALGQLNDGNLISGLTGADDIRITAQDGTQIDVNLDSVTSLGDIISAINDDSNNSGKITASLSSGRLVLTDSTSGSSTLAVEDINGASAVTQLGLDATQSGGVITGNRLSAGMNSVLLRNLNGGSGVGTLGSISVTDRAGNSATLDLSSAETLQEVVDAINSAEDTGTPLSLEASVNSVGNGIVITDTSGSTSSNFIIADVSSSTVAADLNLTIDSAVTEIDSGSLSLRYVNRATALSTYGPNGTAVSSGLIKITDTNGNVGVIDISSAVTTVGDVIDRINANTSISVTAQLNETGDGFALVDEAAGTGTLNVEEFGGTTASELGLLGDATTNSQSKQEISSRQATVIEVESTDTISTLATKLNASDSLVSVSIVNDGSQFNPTRLSLVSKQGGAAGRTIIDDGGLDLGFSTSTEAQDALLLVGSDITSGFLVTSSDNSFTNVVEGIDIEIVKEATTAADIDVSVDTSGIKSAIQSFISAYNSQIAITEELTKFDVETEERGLLQGDAFVFRVSSRLESAITRTYGQVTDPINSLIDLGISFGEGGLLTLDETTLDDALENNFDNVKTFFSDETNGFAVAYDSILTSLTDSVSGTFKIERDSVQAAITRFEDRMEELEESMEAFKNRLLLDFVAMENILSDLESQQTALSELTKVQSSN